MIGDALHGGDDHGDAGCPHGGANKTRSMQHAFRAEKRTAAELEGDYVPALLARAAGERHSLAQLGAASFRSKFFRYVFETHDLALLVSPCDGNRWSVSGGGLKEETHRQVRFWRWVGNFLLVR